MCVKGLTLTRVIFLVSLSVEGWRQSLEDILLEESQKI